MVVYLWVGLCKNLTFVSLKITLWSRRRSYFPLEMRSCRHLAAAFGVSDYIMYKQVFNFLQGLGL